MVASALGVGVEGLYVDANGDGMCHFDGDAASLETEMAIVLAGPISEELAGYIDAWQDALGRDDDGCDAFALSGLTAWVESPDDRLMMLESASELAQKILMRDGLSVEAIAECLA